MIDQHSMTKARVGITRLGVAVVMVLAGMLEAHRTSVMQANGSVSASSSGIAENASGWRLLMDMGTATSPAATDWQRVTSGTLHTDQSGFGWTSDVGLSATDQGSANLLTRDFVTGSQPATLRISLPPEHTASSVYEIWLLLANVDTDVGLITLGLPNASGTPTRTLASQWMDSSGHLSTHSSAPQHTPEAHYIWGIQTPHPYLDITFSTVSEWQVNAIAVYQQKSRTYVPTSAEAVISNQHTAPAFAIPGATYVPTRYPWISAELGDADQDWEHVIAWRDQFISADNSAETNFRLLAAQIATFAGPVSASNHPVDVITQGNGSCTGIANLMVMLAWSLGLPARNVVIYTDNGIRTPIYAINDPNNNMAGRAHEIVEVLFADGWHAIENDGSDLGTYMSYMGRFAQHGVIETMHSSAVRSVAYYGWGPDGRWRVNYSPATAAALYPTEANYRYRLLTHDPRYLRTLRIDDVVEFADEPVLIRPGMEIITKTFWLDTPAAGVERIVSRLPILHDYHGIPQVSDWQISINGSARTIGTAGIDWPAGRGGMIEVQLSPGELVPGWNTLTLSAVSTNTGEGLWVSTFSEHTSTSSRILTDSVNLSERNVVWYLDVEYAAQIDTAPPDPPLVSIATGADASSLELTWQTAGDDWWIGAAITYEVRMSTSTLTSLAWTTATLVATGTYPVGPWPQGAADNPVVLQTGALQSDQNYLFGVTVYDQAGNASDMSIRSLSTSASQSVPTPTSTAAPPTATPTPPTAPSPTAVPTVAPPTATPPAPTPVATSPPATATNTAHQFQQLVYLPMLSSHP
jgi:Transglutaminase-like superfamily